MSYPVTYLALAAEDAGLLRRWHESGQEATVLARVRKLATSPAVNRLPGARRVADDCGHGHDPASRYVHRGRQAV